MTNPVPLPDSVKPSIGKRRRNDPDELNDEPESEPDDNGEGLNGDGGDPDGNDGDLDGDGNPYHDDGNSNGNDDPGFEGGPATVTQTSNVRQAPDRNDKHPCSRNICSLFRLDVTRDDTVMALLYVEKPIFIQRFSKLLIDVYMQTPLFKDSLQAEEVSVSDWTS